MEDDILTIEEVAKYLRVSERTVYDWAQKGEIPAGKIGTVWRFKKSEIEKWVNDRLAVNKTPQSLQTVQIQNILSDEQNGENYYGNFRNSADHSENQCINVVS